MTGTKRKQGDALNAESNIRSKKRSTRAPLVKFEMKTRSRTSSAAASESPLTESATLSFNNSPRSSNHSLPSSSPATEKRSTGTDRRLSTFGSLEKVHIDTSAVQHKQSERSTPESINSATKACEDLFDPLPKSLPLPSASLSKAYRGKSPRHGRTVGLTRRAPGRQRIQKSDPKVEADHKRQAELKYAFKNVTKGLYPALGELAKRAKASLENDPQAHKHALEHLSTQIALNQRLYDRVRVVDAEQRLRQEAAFHELKEEQIQTHKKCKDERTRIVEIAQARIASEFMKKYVSNAEEAQGVNDAEDEDLTEDERVFGSKETFDGRSVLGLPVEGDRRRDLDEDEVDDSTWPNVNKNYTIDDPNTSAQLRSASELSCDRYLTRDQKGGRFYMETEISFDEWSTRLRLKDMVKKALALPQIDDSSRLEGIEDENISMLLHAGKEIERADREAELKERHYRDSALSIFADIATTVRDEELKVQKKKEEAAKEKEVTTASKKERRSRKEKARNKINVPTHARTPPTVSGVPLVRGQRTLAPKPEARSEAPAWIPYQTPSNQMPPPPPPRAAANPHNPFSSSGYPAVDYGLAKPPNSPNWPRHM